MAELTIQGSGVTDVTIADDTPTTNLNGETYLNVGEHNATVAVKKSLVKFDLSAIPAASTIIDATMTLTYQGDASDNARTLNVFRVKRAWSDSQATWNVYTTGNSWTSAGCNDDTDDRDGTPVGSVAVPASPTLDTEVSITIDATAVATMINGGANGNNGFLLQNTGLNNDLLLYHSTEASTSGFRPKLVINYTPPPETNNKSYAYFM